MQISHPPELGLERLTNTYKSQSLYFLIKLLWLRKSTIYSFIHLSIHPSSIHPSIPPFIQYTLRARLTHGLKGLQPWAPDFIGPPLLTFDFFSNPFLDDVGLKIGDCRRQSYDNVANMAGMYSCTRGCRQESKL